MKIVTLAPIIMPFLTVVGQASLGGPTGAESLRVIPITNAVNRLQVQGAATGGGVGVGARGSDTNVPLFLNSQGSGSIFFGTASSALTQFEVSHSANAVNRLMVTGGATSNPPNINATGPDTNIDVAINPKGTFGLVRFGAVTVNADAPITGYVTIRDAAGTTRKLAIIA